MKHRAPVSAAPTGPVIERRALLAGGVALTLAVVGCQRREFSCTDVRGLPPEDRAARQAVGYLDRAPDAARACDVCQQWQAGASDCGTCKVVRGPIHPQGTCNLFARRA